MPLELGIDLGCKWFSKNRSDKSLLIFDSELYRFQKYVSDLGGQDIQKHGNSPELAVKSVRNWLRTESGRNDIPGGSAIYERYTMFRLALPAIRKKLRDYLLDLS